jgi:hypothetical protein
MIFTLMTGLVLLVPIILTMHQIAQGSDAFVRWVGQLRRDGIPVPVWVAQLQSAVRRLLGHHPQRPDCAAQQPAMPVVGFLFPGTIASSESYVTPFRQGLSEAGYVEGRDVAITVNTDMWATLLEKQSVYRIDG